MDMNMNNSAEKAASTSEHSYPKKVRRKSSSSSRPTPLMAEADAPKIARPCTECGKKFWSWKALFGHMRCHPERQWRGINPPPNLRRDDHCYSEEDHEVAECLLLLANSSNPPDYCCKKQSKLKLKRQDENFHSHTCSICSRAFSSGRALGGHKRLHCRDKYHTHTHTRPPPPNLYFDLNLLPPLQEDHSSSALDLRLGL